MKILVSAFFGTLFQIALFAAVLLLPAMRLDWLEANIWLATYSAIVLPTSVYLALYHPSGLEARMRYGRQQQPAADKFATTLIVAVMVGSLSLCPVDVFGWQVFAKPPMALQLVGLAVFILGLGLTILTIVQNDFVTPTVHIQEDQGHHLVDTGLYAHVRHPMYTGFLLLMMGSYLWLGSYLMLCAGTLSMLLALTLRMHIEERTLRADLEGYEDYMGRVKARIIPYIY